MKGKKGRPRSIANASPPSRYNYFRQINVLWRGSSVLSLSVDQSVSSCLSLSLPFYVCVYASTAVLFDHTLLTAKGQKRESKRKDLSLSLSRFALTNRVTPFSFLAFTLSFCVVIARCRRFCGVHPPSDGGAKGSVFSPEASASRRRENTSPPIAPCKKESGKKEKEKGRRKEKSTNRKGGKRRKNKLMKDDQREREK